MRAFETSDYAQIMSWWEKRGKSPLPIEYFSTIGFIEENQAAAFLYTTNSAIAYIDNLIANPDVDANDALDSVVQACIAEAKLLGFRILTGTTSRPYVSTRAERNGFTVCPGYSQLVMKL